MTARNRIFQAALWMAAALVPAGMLPAQEAMVVTGEGETVVVESGGGAVEVEAHSAPRKSGPFAPRSTGGNLFEGPSSESPGKSSSKPPSSSSDQSREKRDGKEEKPDEKSNKENGDKKPDEDQKSPEDQKPEGAEETVKRPTGSEEPVDPDAIRKMKLDENGKVRLNFTGHPWPDVLRWLAHISGMSLDWQELPGDHLNLITQRSYTLDEVRDMINRHLLARGYTMVRLGEVLWVVKIEKLNPSMVPRVEPEELDQRDPHEFVKVCFTLDWMLAHQAVAELQPMLSTYGKLSPLNATNRLEAMDAVVNLRELRKFLEEEQSSESRQELVREFILKHTRADEIKEEVLALLGVPPTSGRAPSGPVNPQQMQQMQQEMQKQMQKQMQQQMQQAAAAKAAAANKGGATTPRPPETRVSLLVNQRKNSILVLAPPDKMVIIAQTITALDVPREGADTPGAFLSRMQIYRLETIDPEPIVKTLRELGDLDPRTRLEVDKANKLIIAHASLLDHATIQLLVSKLDGGGRRCHVIPLEKLRAESVAETVAFMMGGGKKETSSNSDRGGGGYSPFGYPYGGYSSSRYRSSSQPSTTDRFRVEPDVKNNALVLWANEFEAEKVQELLENLRELPPQDSDTYTVHVYRLAAIEPAPVVKTLKDMDTLGPHATLEVDEKHKAIIAYASPEEHGRIADLLEKLDGSARNFSVIHLRRLDAENVAGTIEFMLGGGGGEKKNQYESRYDYYPYTSRMRPTGNGKEDQFRVDADLEYNRLLLWANEIELQDVQNLLVELGEIPEEGGNPDTVRVLDTGGGAELEALIERIRSTWTAPNQLIVVPPEKPGEADQPTIPEEQVPEPASPLNDTTTQALRQPLIRLVRFSPQQTGAEASQEPAAEGAGAEAPEEPAREDPPAPSADAPEPQPESEGSPDAAEEGPVAKVAPAPAQSSPGGDGSAEPANESPAAAPPAPPAAGQDTAESPPPPVRISWGPDGRVIIASEDPKILDELEDILNQYAPPRRDYKVFQLKYAMAYWVAMNLEDFFEEKEENRGGGRYYDPYWGGFRYGGGNTSDNKARLSKRQPVKFISDSDTNTILVQNAGPGQLKTIDELIQVYDAPEPPDTQSMRKTEIFMLKYSKARVMEKALKDVYLDLLSSNDKALREGQPRPERSITYNLGDGGGVQKMPRWKGQLSIGVDELSNALIVSAPAYLFDEVKAKILALDEAAKPVSTVRVIKIDGRLSAAGLQEKLSEIIGQGSGRRPPSRSSSPPRSSSGPSRSSGPPSRSSSYSRSGGR